jgi:hypothetical protein
VAWVFHWSDIGELILGRSDKVQAVVIGVGGYLGIGNRAIAVPFDQIRFVNEPRVNTTGTGDRRGPIGGSQPRRRLRCLTVSSRLQQSFPVEYRCEQRTGPCCT